MPPFTVTNLDAYIDHLRSGSVAKTWWVREALNAIERGHIHPIRARTSDRLYLMRYWLSEPDTLGDEDRWDSSDSLLLHHFLMPDDDSALHDHPWDFETTILTGKYLEALPPDGWLPHPDLPGPALDTNLHWRCAGDQIAHDATDLHAVLAIAPDTWTLVRTYAKERTWFFHPPGQPPVHYRDYLNLAPAAAGLHHGKNPPSDQGSNEISYTNYTRDPYYSDFKTGQFVPSVEDKP